MWGASYRLRAVTNQPPTCETPWPMLLSAVTPTFIVVYCSRSDYSCTPAFYWFCIRKRFVRCSSAAFPKVARYKSEIPPHASTLSTTYCAPNVINFYALPFSLKHCFHFLNLLSWGKSSVKRSVSLPENAELIVTRKFSREMEIVYQPIGSKATQSFATILAKAGISDIIRFLLLQILFLHHW